jgi:outer membrane protein
MKKAFVYFSLVTVILSTMFPDALADSCYYCSPASPTTSYSPPPAYSPPPSYASSSPSPCFLCNPPPNPWLIRERIINIDPSNSTDQGDVNINHYSMLELDASYFFTKNIAAEFSVTAEDPDASARDSGTSLGNVWIIPFDLMLQYHFIFPNNNPFQPYAGLGLNYSYFYTSSNNVTYDSSLGPVYQIGMDYILNRNWSLNLDLKRVYMRPDVSINGSPKVTDDIYPWIIGLGVGYKF